MVKTFQITDLSPGGDNLFNIPDGAFIAFASLENYAKFLSLEKSRFIKDVNKKTKTSSDLSQFELFKTLGRGAFGTVYLAKSKKSNSFVVLKCMNKREIVDRSLVQQTINEKRIMSAIRFNFVLNIIDSFMDNSYMYFIMPYLSGGDLGRRLSTVNNFDENATKFYVAQVVLALQYLHELKIAHRDLKPENLSLDQQGFLRLIDFGLSKTVMNKTYTFCGTPEYIAPEVILGRGHDCSVDWWSLGILSYHLRSGTQPFFASKQDRLFGLIVDGKFVIRDFFSESFEELLSQLISIDVSKRAGCGKGGAEDVKKLEWFSDIDWLALLNKKVPIAFAPTNDMLGLANFKNFKEDPLVVSSINCQRAYFTDF